MFSNRIARIRSTKGVGSHRYSSQLSQKYPFRQLRAYPFQLSPEDAVVQLAPYASTLCVFKNFLGSLGARYLPGFGFEPIRPLRITPVYFPAWVVDAEVQVDVSYNDTQRMTTAHIHDSYLPGSDFRILSLSSFFSRQLRAIEPVIFTPELETQYNTEVACLPYTISPFTVLDIARTLSYTDATITPNLRFKPPSIKPELFAAYPVLIPLYVAQYEPRLPSSSTTPRTITLFMEAYSSTGRIFTENVDASFRKDLSDTMPALTSFLESLQRIEGEAHSLRGVPSPFIRIAGMLMPDNRELPQPVMNWLDKHLESPGTAEILALKTSALTDTDPRIREYTLQERETNLEWMKLGAEISSLNMIVETMSSATKGARVTTIGGGKDIDPAQLMAGAVKSMRMKIEGLEVKRKETIPTWWTSWLKDSTT
ncbi:hypothetical protein BDZ94DRAFT_1247203 [Collybia nuda]|uniref:Uncharacterized protein n=1 Tax=Collybia nuda TaxID=64659 RepID=A0A9P5YDS5_9AGAR|nr:hypothetical protein BDZ94DRAFT_1247203 [Collybia nuda]